MTDRIAYTVQEAAEVAAVSEQTIRRAFRSGALAVHYPTTRPVIMRDDLEAWLRSAPSEAAS